MEENNNLEINSKETKQIMRRQIYRVFSLNGELCSFSKGSIVFRDKDIAHEAYIVENGRVKIYKLTPEGKEVTYNILNYGEGLGLAEVILGCCRMRNAEAITANTKLWRLNKRELLELIDKDKELSYALFFTVSRHMIKYQNMVENLALSVEGRVVQFLVRLSEERGRKKNDHIIIDFPLTHEEIAKMIGCTRQTVTTILNDLRNQGIINWNQKKIEILLWETLLNRNSFA